MKTRMSDAAFARFNHPALTIADKVTIGLFSLVGAFTAFTLIAGMLY